MLVPQAAVEHRLDSVDITIRPGIAVAVVLASEGYPGNYSKGNVITFGDMPSGELPDLIYHADLIIVTLQVLSYSTPAPPSLAMMSLHLVVEFSQCPRTHRRSWRHLRSHTPASILSNFMGRRSGAILLTGADHHSITPNPIS